MHLFSSSQRRVLILILLLVVSVCLAVQVFAQSTMGTGSIQGTVTNQLGAAQSGAKVTITSKATGAAQQFSTSSTGTYSSGPLQPGSYAVRIEATGFKTVALALNVEVGIATAGSVRLQPGPANQIVDIQGSGMAVNTEQATVQSVVTANQMSSLPVNGRSFMDAAQLVPGVQEQDGSTFDPTKNGFSSISFLSRYGRTARIIVDGADISDETVGTTTQNIPVSAIQEVNLSQSLLGVTTDLTSSGEVNLTTRSGSNALHGEGFGLFRGDQISAHLPGLTAPTFEREQFGGRMGGYIIKDKLFWFLSGERTMQDFTSAEPFSAPFNLLNTTLSQPFREFQADGRLDWFSPQHGHAFLRFLFDQNNQIRPYGSASSVQAFENENHTPSGTVGYDFTKGNYNHSFRFAYLRFRNGIVDSTGSIPAGVNNPIPGLGINIGASVAGSCLLSAGGAYCAGPNYLAPQKTFQSDLQFRYDGSRVWGNHVLRFGGTYNRIQSGVSAAFVTFPQAGTTSICLPTSTPGNCLTSSDPTAYPAQSVFLGNGIGFSTPNSAFGMPGGGLGPDNRIELYVGDTWNVKPTLTLIYGLRYVRDTGRVDTALGPEPALNLWQPGLGAQVRTPSTNFAPQFGFVWDASGAGKTVVRGGAGLYYENSIWNNVLFDSPARRQQGIFAYTPQVCSAGVPGPFTWPTNPGGVGTSIASGAGVVVTGTNQVQPTFCGGAISAVANQILALSSAFQAATASAGAQANPNFVGTSLNAANANGFDLFAPNYRTPRAWQMNFGFEHEFRPGTVLSIDVVRNVGLHFLLGIDQNHSGAARSYNMANALTARDRAQLANGCTPGIDQANCMVLRLGQVGAQAAYSAAGLDSNIAVTAGAPCSFCAFPGVTPNGQNNAGNGGGNGSLGALDMLEPVGRSVYDGLQLKLTENILHPYRFVKHTNLVLAYAWSKFTSQAQDQDFINLATDNDNALRFTGPNALDRRHQISFGATFDLPFYARLSVIGHFYSPLPQNLLLPELTNGGEIFATDWLGSGLGSGASPEPVPGTQIGQFMRGTDATNLQRVLSQYNTHFAGTLTPAGHCLVGDGQCPGSGPVQVMSLADMGTLGWVMPQLASVPPDAQNFTWLKTMDIKAAWPIKIRERVTVEPSAAIFNVFNFANSFMPGNLPLASLLPGGSNQTLAPNSVGGVTGASIMPFRASFQSGTYALGVPRQIEFGLRVEF
jgi:hypothetical protein